MEKKTNRKIFMEKLKNADTHEFVRLITGVGKC